MPCPRQAKAIPPDTTLDYTHYRIRHDRIDPSGVFTLRHNSCLHHIGVGRRHAGTDILVLVFRRADLETGATSYRLAHAHRSRATAS